MNKVNKFIIILISLFIIVPELSANFLGEMDNRNKVVAESFELNINLIGQIVFGLLPFGFAIGFMFLIKKFGKKHLMQGNEDDKWMYYGALIVGAVAGFFLGWYIVELLGSFLLGSAEKAQALFNKIWAKWLGA